MWNKNSLSPDIVTRMNRAVSENIGPYPAIYLSGGLDSSIILHHLVRDIMDPLSICAYTADFEGVSNNECDKALKVARYFGVNWTPVTIKKDQFIRRLPAIQRLFDIPRFNVWPFWLAEAAAMAGRETVFIGEGSDEVFGGYDDRDYLGGWAGQIVWVAPTFNAIHDYFGLNLRRPFFDLAYWQRQVFAPSNKNILREAYKDTLPKFILDTPGQPPAFTNYNEFIPKETLKKLAVKAWLHVHDGWSY